MDLNYFTRDQFLGLLGGLACAMYIGFCIGCAWTEIRHLKAKEQQA